MELMALLLGLYTWLEDIATLRQCWLFALKDNWALAPLHGGLYVISIFYLADRSSTYHLFALLYLLLQHTEPWWRFPPTVS
jgi:hypothetical protein